MTRRKFLFGSCLAAYTTRTASAAAALNPDSLVKFVDPLPIPPLAKSSGLRPIPGQTSKAPYYRVAMRQIESKLHRDLPPTRLWTCGGSSPGPTFEARRGQGLVVEWANELPAKHFLPIDHSLHGAEESNPEVRGVIHALVSRPYYGHQSP